MPKSTEGSTGQILSLTSLVPSLIPLFASPHQSLKSCWQTQERMKLLLPYLFNVQYPITSPTRHKYILHAKFLPRVSLLSKDWERSKSSERLSGLPSTIDRVQAARKYRNPVALGPGWMGWWEAWQSYDDGIKVVSKSERWHFCRPQANIGQGNGWALYTHERRKVFYYWSWYFLRSFTSFHAHTNTEMPSQWSSAVVPGSLFTALRRTSRCCFSEKSQRCLTESSQTNWLISSYNVLKNDAISQSRKGYTSMKSNGCMVSLRQIDQVSGLENAFCCPVLFLLARLSWGELLSKRKIV